MTILRNPWMQRALSLVMGGVFIYASLDKIWWPERFARIVYHYQIIGPNALFPPLAPNLLAATLPWIEALAGFMLVLGVWRRESALLIAFMLAVFVGAVGWTLYQGIDIENCGCFSLTTQGRHAGLALILEDLILLAGAALLAFLPAKKPSSR
ncbi:MAG: DoxX family membrane protein [Vicinamibacteria bacterium]|nr:DoxX family membrane protein [Vicinamibacteria bacterium]